MTGTDFFLNHNYQTLTCTCQSSAYSPPESAQFFQRSGSTLMPFSKKACGWRRIHSQRVRKPHALQVWFEPSEQVEITWGQIGTVRRMCQKVPFQFPEGFHCCFGRMAVVVPAGTQKANVVYFQRKIRLSGILCISGWLAFPINTDKWSYTVIFFHLYLFVM